MKLDLKLKTTAVPTTLQDVIDRLADNGSLSETRRRDLRSAVVSFGKLIDKAPALIPLDLATIRTKAIKLDARWSSLLQPVTDKRVRNGLSRLARWASRCRVAPALVDDAIIARFIVELAAASLVRGIRDLHRSVAASWNALVRLQPEQGLNAVKVPSSKPAPKRVAWEHLPASFRVDVGHYLAWAAMPDPLDENARARALAPRTLRLRRDHIHSAATASVCLR
jgi:hypothetical protein